MSWRDLVNYANGEPVGARAVSAAVWEAVWRVDPDLEPQWTQSGPAVLGEELRSPNPYLRERSPESDWIGQATRVDPEAGALLATALRAEGVECWWNPEAVLRQHAQAWVKYATWEREAAGSATDGKGVVESSTAETRRRQTRQTDRDYGELVEQLEECLTRLILIGHPPTTQYVLPELLAFDLVGSGSGSFGELNAIRVALSRLRAGERLRTCISTARLLSGRALAERNRPPEITRFLEAAAAKRSSSTTVAILFAGTAVSRRSTGRLTSSRRAATVAR
jgi:hypothetical protein